MDELSSFGILTCTDAPEASPKATHSIPAVNTPRAEMTMRQDEDEIADVYRVRFIC